MFSGDNLKIKDIHLWQVHLPVTPESKNSELRFLGN